MDEFNNCYHEQDNYNSIDSKEREKLQKMAIRRVAGRFKAEMTRIFNNKYLSVLKWHCTLIYHLNILNDHVFALFSLVDIIPITNQLDK